MLSRRTSAGACLALLMLPLAVPARGQGVASEPPGSIVGTWRGSSVGTSVGKPACHDEHVVYHFTRAGDDRAARAAMPSQKVERLRWVMNKVVNGREEGMGDLVCTYTTATRVARCPMRDWMWTFAARGNGLTGTLANPSGVVWRNVRVSRSAT